MQKNHPIAKPALVEILRARVAEYGTYRAAAKSLGVSATLVQNICCHPDRFEVGHKIAKALGYQMEPPRYRRFVTAPKTPSEINA
jgi:hypothetical protein